MTRLLTFVISRAVRWVAGPLAVRWLLGRLSRSALDTVGAELDDRAEQRLPASLAKAVVAAPQPVRDIGASAVVATRAARVAGTAARYTGRGVKTATASGRSMRRAIGRRTDVSLVAAELRRETDAATRQLRARYLGNAHGPSAATDALLDLRAAETNETGAVDPLDEVPPPIGPGRRRHRRRRQATVDRPSRSYQRPAKPWD